MNLTLDFRTFNLTFCEITVHLDLVVKVISNCCVYLGERHRVVRILDLGGIRAFIEMIDDRVERDAGIADSVNAFFEANGVWNCADGRCHNTNIIAWNVKVEIEKKASSKACWQRCP